ncbi:MAG: hypothetical protein KAU17_15765 [Spirochaetales bacterium]|nr:hypothetical protein [Spirochaetales bacterium]
MTKGTVTNLWFLLQDGLLNNVYYLIAPFLKQINYYYLFYLSLFFDEMVLIIGSILLSKILYKNSWTILFVVIAIIGTVNWASQIWWNFHLYYMFPLILFFYIKAFSERSLIHFFLGNLFVVIWSFYGNLTYFVTVFSFFIFLFIILFLLFNRFSCPNVSAKLIKKDDTIDRIQLGLSIPVNKQFWLQSRQWITLRNVLKISLVLILSSIPLFIIYKYITQCGAGEIVFHNVGRGKDGIVSMTEFLTYGGNVGYSKFIELITGVSQSPDQSLYIGVFALVFCFLQIYYLYKRLSDNRFAIILLLVIIFSISFSTGGAVATLAYIFWPFMKLYRHIGLVNSLTKIMLIFFAGFALDQLLYFIRNKNFQVCMSSLKIMASLLSFILLIKGIFLFMPIRYHGPIFSGADEYIFPFKIISFLLIIIYLAAYAIIKKYNISTSKSMMTILIVICLLQFAELSVFRFSYYNMQLPKLKTEEFFNTFSFQNYGYSAERNQNYSKNKRWLEFSNVSNTLHSDLVIVNNWGVLYWSSESFFFFDACSSIFRVDHHLNGINDYYHTYNDKFLPFNIEQPLSENKAFLKIMGCNSPKLQTFKNMYYVDKPENYMKNLLYKGDVLFTDTKNGNSVIIKIDKDDVDQILSTNERIEIPIHVKEFSANQINIELNNNFNEPVVLHYADGYHKYWKAFVNGKEEKIYKSNKAFKAIIIPPGKAEVEFIFREPKVIWAMYFFIFLGLCGVLIVCYYAFSIIKDTGSRPGSDCVLQ